MPGTMTYVGFDVHARSTHAAAIDVMTRRVVPGAVRPGGRCAGRLADGRCRDP